jgi:hypothetical protein
VGPGDSVDRDISVIAKGNAVRMLTDAFPVLQLATGDWAAKYFLRNRHKTMKETKKRKNMRREEPELYAKKKRKKDLRVFTRLRGAFGAEQEEWDGFSKEEEEVVEAPSKGRNSGTASQRRRKWWKPPSKAQN